MSEPPLDGLLHVTRISSATDVATTLTPVTCPGTLARVVSSEFAETVPPGNTLLIALTLNLTFSPGLKFSNCTVLSEADAVCVAPRLASVTRYPVMALPPSDKGALQLTVAVRRLTA